MLKKQTVWLLTMLSLMIVLSVYYMTSPSSGDLAYLPEDDDSAEETASDASENDDTDKNDSGANVDDISNLEENQLFTSIRMEIREERSAAKERLDDVVASSSASMDEKNEAKNKINRMEEISRKEKMLEQSIIASADYNDVLVRHEDDQVFVHVKDKENLSNSEVVNMMQMVRDEFGNIEVKVDNQAMNK
ncbi:SpoIIIAH-like family protein [Lentibacillus halophilus]|uniref:SpoIIIAH-like family protein n=1 Tax=Lentibacillus halophilus TaxID=295065 RepID=A0ABN0ZCT8_9BACI